MLGPLTVDPNAHPPQNRIRGVGWFEGVNCSWETIQLCVKIPPNGGTLQFGLELEYFEGMVLIVE